MAIKYQPEGYGKFVQGLAAQAGAAEAATKTAEMAFQMAEADKDRQFRAQMQNLQYEVQLESARRSAMWDIEKMEIRSRIDFEDEEKKRVQRKQQLDLDLQSLDKAAKEYLIDPKELPKMKEATYLKYMDLPEAASQLFRPKTEAQIMEEMLNKAQGGTAVSPTGTPTAPSTKPVAAPKTQFQAITSGPQGLVAIDQTGNQLPIQTDKYYRATDDKGNLYQISGDEVEKKVQEGWNIESEIGAPIQLDVKTPSVNISKEDKELSGGKVLYDPTTGEFYTNTTITESSDKYGIKRQKTVPYEVEYAKKPVETSEEPKSLKRPKKKVTLKERLKRAALENMPVEPGRKPYPKLVPNEESLFLTER